MSDSNPSILILPLLTYLLYRKYPRPFHCLSMSLALCFWRSSDHPSIKHVFELCSKGRRDAVLGCSGYMWLFSVEFMVYTVAVMSAIAEVEGLLEKRRGKDSIEMGRLNDTVETKSQGYYRDGKGTEG